MSKCCFSLSNVCCSLALYSFLLIVTRQLVDRLRIFVIRIWSVQDRTVPTSSTIFIGHKDVKAICLETSLLLSTSFHVLQYGRRLVCKCNVTVVFYNSTRVLTAFHCLPRLYAAIIYTIRVIFIANSQTTTQQQKAEGYQLRVWTLTQFRVFLMSRPLRWWRWS